ncbi:MAG: MFS transporter [Alphaproteobacteria bacterium]|nr:MFS transporter [Alphaproteobacteria bacterium]
MNIIPPSAGREARLVLVNRTLRAFADGYVAVILPLHLAVLGMGAVEIGVIATATLFGSALLNLAVGFAGSRYSQRGTLLAASLLMVMTGIGFAWFDSFWPLLIIALIGTLNPSGGDVSVFLPLEQTILAQSVAPAERTALFARYSFLSSIMIAFGALGAGLVDAAALVVELRTALTGMFLLYAAIGAAAFGVYWLMPPDHLSGTRRAHAPLGPSRGRVWRLAALFSVDAFGGGFIVNSLLALWLYQRFDLSVSTAGTIFFVTGVCSAVSFFIAERLAARFGLINTMVFTHLPSSVLLILAAFAPDLWLAAALLVVRALLSQMDVPTRASFVMAVVTPAERPAAASLTTVPRSLASSLAPAMSGAMLAATPFGWPLIIAGCIKIAYDLELLRQFARIKPPEEALP